MRKYPSALFRSGVLHHLIHAVFLWLPMVVCLIAGFCGITILFPAAFALCVGWILYAVGREKQIADAYESDSADPAFVAAVEEEYRKRFEPDDRA